MEKRSLGLAIAAVVYVLACSREGSRPGSASGGATPAAGPGPGADAGYSPSAGASPGPDGGAGPPEVVPFIENDYPRALAEARARHLPLFIDAWAPWCHTCLSMRAYVFADARLRPLAPRFVWLSLDTERDENAPVVARFGVHVLPTLFVIDAATEQARLAWAGSLTALELTRVLEDVQLAADGPRADGEAMAMLLSGHRASAAENIAGAIDDYRAALAAAPAGWPARAEAVDALVLRLSDARRLNECVSVAAAEVPRMPPGTPLADTLRSAIGCARELPPGAPERERLAELVEAGERVVSDMTQPLLADDRSDLYDYVISALGALGRRGDAKRMAAAWASFLDGEAARAPTPSARAVFDAHRLLAYTAIGEPQRAVPMLEQSEKDFPDDYNPPARLGVALLETKRYDEALAALTRALDRAYGPRKLHLWSLEADVLVAKGDTAGARDALRRALDFAATLPLAGSYPALREAIAKRLAGLSRP